jgi:hypothetical protein
VLGVQRPAFAVRVDEAVAAERRLAALLGASAICK